MYKEFPQHQETSAKGGGSSEVRSDMKLCSYCAWKGAHYKQIIPFLSLEY